MLIFGLFWIGLFVVFTWVVCLNFIWFAWLFLVVYDWCWFGCGFVIVVLWVVW